MTGCAFAGGSVVTVGAVAAVRLGADMNDVKNVLHHGAAGFISIWTDGYGPLSNLARTVHMPTSPSDVISMAQAMMPHPPAGVFGAGKNLVTEGRKVPIANETEIALRERYRIDERIGKAARALIRPGKWAVGRIRGAKADEDTPHER